jgi:hypothetical protein
VGERGLTNVLNLPGEFIPQCGCTVDVIAAELSDITIGGKPLSEGHPLIVSIGEEDGSTRVTLNLSAGHRVRVRQQPPEWQPIETAPKDGTDVLVWWPDWMAQPIRVANFEVRHRCWVTGSGSSAQPPTHWMPLPQPPSAEGDRS